jgi:hypothetical protein
MPDTLSRSMHDLGLAAWSGGTLANAVALNQAAGHAHDARSTGAVANAGWDRWTPVNGAAIGVHLLGSVGLLLGNRSRILGQQGVGSMSLVKTALTGAALAATGYARVLGRTVSDHERVPAESGTAPTDETPDEVARAQRQLRLLQWAVPALSGAVVVVNAYAGEQQRATEQARGLVRRVLPG